MIEMQQKRDVSPLCPHCEAELRTIWMQELSGFFGRRYVYYCPECRKVLGLSHRKGFFMG
jgi:uncharacterized protein with PIN domain